MILQGFGLNGGINGVKKDSLNNKLMVNQTNLIVNEIEDKEELVDVNTMPMQLAGKHPDQNPDLQEVPQVDIIGQVAYLGFQQ